MPTPPGTSLRTIVGTVLDASNEPHQGEMVWDLLTDVSAVSGVVQSSIRVRLRPDGTFSVSLLVPTDHVAFPGGWTYQLSEWYDGGTYRRTQFALDDTLAAPPATTDLDTLTPVADPVTSGKYATKEELNDLKSKISWTYVQYELATTWVIVHNLGYYPNVFVIDNTNEYVVANIHPDSANQTTLTFNNATAGRAFFS